MHQINIKNEETYRLVQQLTALTGESMTQAIRRAVRDRVGALERQQQESRKGLAKELLALGKACAALPTLDDRDPDEMLYDENGLPK